MADGFSLTVFDKTIPSFSGLFERALYIAPDDSLAATAVNRWRANGTLPADLPIRTSAYVPAGYGFLADDAGSGQIMQFVPDDPATLSDEATDADGGNKPRSRPADAGSAAPSPSTGSAQ